MTEKSKESKLLINDLPLVSVLMPCYNHEEYVISSLESVASSDYKLIEFIFIDDASMDNSFNLAKKWFENNKGRFVRTVCIQHEKNRGICATINELYSLSQGEYITDLASDDLLLINAISKQVSFALDHKVDFVFSDCQLIDESGNLIADSALHYFGKNSQRFKRNICLVTDVIICWEAPWHKTFMASALVKKIGPYDESLCFEDRDYIIRALINGSYKFMSIPTMAYRIRLKDRLTPSLNIEEILRDFYRADRKNYLNSSGIIKLLLGIGVYCNEERYRELEITNAVFISRVSRMFSMLKRLILKVHRALAQPIAEADKSHVLTPPFFVETDMNDKNKNTTISPLQFTGERYVPELSGDIELEHFHRYLLAKQVVAGKTVLDIASGEGYGSAMLAQTAQKVIGVDISQEAVSHAQAKYQAKNLEFRLGSCSAIPLADDSVDVVVSFETIEHHAEHEAMMLEIKRVLRTDGALVISCPDKLENSDKPGSNNPHHVKELYRDEFNKLLDSHFKSHSIYGQRVVYGSAIFCEDGMAPTRNYDLSDDTISPICGVPHAVYLLAVASDTDLPVLNSGILEHSIKDSDFVRLLIAKFADERDAIYTSIYSSRSWRLTRPLRFLARLIR